jgi:hypothetical protein
MQQTELKADPRFAAFNVDARPTAYSTVEDQDVSKSLARESVSLFTYEMYPVLSRTAWSY